MQFSEVDYRDIQGLVRFGYAHLPEARFHLLEIADAAKTREWIGSVAKKVTNAVAGEKPRHALHIAFTARGLCRLGIPLEGFSPEFRIGMVEDSRSRRLGDVSKNAPGKWRWGAPGKQYPDVLVLLYAEKDGLDAWETKVKGELWSAAFTQNTEPLTTIRENDQEPFGFVDGVSQPRINWDGEARSRREPPTTEYTNLSAVGEFVLGHLNEYGYHTDRPLLAPSADPDNILPLAEDKPNMRDLGRNGTYLVLRDLGQAVSAFDAFIKHAAATPQDQHVLKSAMAGRVPADLEIIPQWPNPPLPPPPQKPGCPQKAAYPPPWQSSLAIDDPKEVIPSGGPVTPLSEEVVPGIGSKMRDIWLDYFTFKNDPDGTACPYGAHIRRANPRNADLPQGTRGLFNRILRKLGFMRQHPHEDVLSSTRFHRILRRGRRYRDGEHEGLRFIALNANIARQFEFIQISWLANPKFNSLDEDDPLVAAHLPLVVAAEDPRLPIAVATNIFTRPQDSALPCRVEGLDQFVTVNGGAYFFMPGLRALNYIATR